MTSPRVSAWWWSLQTKVIFWATSRRERRLNLGTSRRSTYGRRSFKSVEESQLFTSWIFSTGTSKVQIYSWPSKRVPRLEIWTCRKWCRRASSRLRQVHHTTQVRKYGDIRATIKRVICGVLVSSSMSWRVSSFHSMARTWRKSTKRLEELTTLISHPNTAESWETSLRGCFSRSLSRDPPCQKSFRSLSSMASSYLVLFYLRTSCRSIDQSCQSPSIVLNQRCDLWQTFTLTRFHQFDECQKLNLYPLKWGSSAAGPSPRSSRLPSPEGWVVAPIEPVVLSCLD